jgi:CDP-4-dehydro-6-deoxyglucose reductase
MNLQARLLETREIAPGVRHFVFAVPEVEQFSFVPGQFVSFHADLNGQPFTRAYSIASAPAGNRFELCLNLVKDGHFSPHLFAMEPGDTVAMSGPFGTFFFRDPPRDSVLIATGTGIAPFRAMLPSRLAADPAHQYSLLFGARYRHGLLYGEEFENLARQFSNFRFWPTLTRPENWTGRTGRVQAHLSDALGNRRDQNVYLCGLKEMVDSIRMSLKSLGFERKQIIYEKYD